MSTALGSGGGAPSQANVWTVAGDGVPDALTAAASASGFGRGTAAAAAPAPATYPRDVGVGVCSIPGGGSLGDPRRFPQRLPPPQPSLRAATWRSQGRLPSFDVMFPADGATSAGHVKRTRLPYEEKKSGNKGKRASGALAEGPHSAEERAPKRRNTPEGTFTGGTGGGGGAGGGCSGQTALPTPALVSPPTDRGGTLWEARPAVAAAAPAGRASPSGRGSPRPALATAAASIGDTTTHLRQPMATASIGAAASPPVAASTGSRDEEQRRRDWSTVLEETRKGNAGRGAFDIGSRTPEETSSTASETDDWDDMSVGGSVQDAARRGGATSTPPAGDATRRATSIAGGDRRWEGTSGGASSGNARGSGGGGDDNNRGNADNAAGGPGGDQRSFGLKARILERSGVDGGSGNLSLPPQPLYEARWGGNYLPTGGLPAAALPSGMVPRLGGGGSSRATAAVALGPGDGAGRLPPGAPQPLPRGGTTRRPVSVAGQYVRRVAESSEIWTGGSGGGVLASGAGTPSGAIGGGTAAGAPPSDVGRAATAGSAPVGSGGGARSAAPMTGAPVVAVAPSPEANTPVADAAATASVAAPAVAATASVAAPAVAARPLRQLAPAPPMDYQQPIVLPAPPPPPAAPARRPYACPTCPMAFKRRYDVQQHISAVHLLQRPFECSHCHKRFGHRGSCAKHERTVHLRQQPYQCDVCGQRFGERGNMAKHRQRHG